MFISYASTILQISCVRSLSIFSYIWALHNFGGYGKIWKQHYPMYFSICYNSFLDGFEKATNNENSVLFSDCLSFVYNICCKWDKYNFIELSYDKYESVPLSSTWLILPVVIRSSQRLSHARLSINIIQ